MREARKPRLVRRVPTRRETTNEGEGVDKRPMDIVRYGCATRRLVIVDGRARILMLGGDVAWVCIVMHVYVLNMWLACVGRAACMREGGRDSDRESEREKGREI